MAQSHIIDYEYFRRIFKNDDLIEFVYTQCGYCLWVPRFIVEQLEEDNIFNGLAQSVPPQHYCQSCDGIMIPISYIGIQGVKYA